MAKNNYKPRRKLGDYVIPCDICGMNCWASQAMVLPPETGRGGLIVCPTDRDAIDYGLIPYVVEPEKPVPISRSNNYTSNPEDVPNDRNPLDISIWNPMNTTGTQAQTIGKTWDQLNDVTWDNWDLPWGS